jgi:hypothetical protein
MPRSWLSIVAAAALLCQTPGPAVAQTVNTDKAQAEMYKRITAAVDSFAARIEAEGDLVSYCWTELRLHTEHPPDESVPYGVNYYNIHSQSQLDQIINVREAYERIYLTLCLSRAKQDLAGALK